MGLDLLKKRMDFNGIIMKMGHFGILVSYRVFNNKVNLDKFYNYTKLFVCKP